MQLKPKQLAIRLGVRPSAISNALFRKKLTIRDDGTIDTEEATNAAYLARFTAHRGKTRATPAATASPGRLEAKRRRLVAQFHRSLARYEARKRFFIPSGWVAAKIDAMEAELTRGLQTLPDSVRLNAPDLERELEKAVSDVLRGAVEAHVDLVEFDAPTIPQVPDGASLEKALEALDLLATARHDWESMVEVGALIQRDDARRRIARWDASRAGLVRQLPRRHVAALRAAPEPREYLKTAIEKEFFYE